jgi:hypothetical protein
MKLTLSSVFLLLATLFLFTSCEKELSLENGGIPGAGTAVYELGGSPLDCAGFIAGGTYAAGVALIPNNTVSFDVSVSNPGAYSVSTVGVNGITFAGTGSFASAGNQTITLEGIGTPTATGDFTYTVTGGGHTCSFIITVISAGPVGAGTIDCATITTAGIYTQGIALTSSNTITVPVNVTTAGSYSITTAATNGVTFSGSGTLAAGNQTIVLTGTGMPVSPGAVSIPLTYGGTSCSVSIDFLPGVAPSGNFLTCNIDGVAKSFNVNLAAINLILVAIDGDETSSATSPNFSISFSNGFNPIDAGVYGLVSPTNFTRLCIPAYDPDGSGTSVWTFASAGQPGGFTANVTSITATKIEGTFNGTLYDNNGAGSNTKVITNGQFSVTF